MPRRLHRARLALATALALVIAGYTMIPTAVAAEPGVTLPPGGVDPAGIGNPYRELNGMVTHYVRDPEGYDGFEYPATTYASITEEISSGWYADRGIRELFIYGPYKSSEHFLGLPPLDFFDVQVGTGTLADWDAMADAAEAAGMPIIVYLEMIYIHPDNPVFIKAAQDRANDVESFERNLFRWDERPQPQASCPSNAGLPSQNTWTRHPSIANNRCYVQAWGSLAGTLPIGFPAFDFDKPEAMQYAKSILAFWMDRGVTGFFYDATHSYLGMHQPTTNATHLARMRELHVTFPNEYVHPDGTTKPKLLHDEGSFGNYSQSSGADLIGYTDVRLQGGDDFDSFPSQAMRVPASGGRTVDQLDDHWATFVDARRILGRGGVASLVYGDDASIPGPIRALDAAVQAGGAGITYYFSYQHHLPDMSPESQELFWDVLRAVGNSTALAPGASRERVPSTSGDNRDYAVLRRSMDGAETALALFNFDENEKCITVNLANTGVTVPQRTTNIATAEPGPWLRSTESTIKLPPYGYLFLDVEAGPGFPWTVADDTDSGWAVGGGWASIVDASAYGGARTGGNTQGAFAEYTFTGRSIEGYGRKNTQGAQEVEVFVDGVSHGIHSQRRTSPISGGSTFHGQKLFSISGLSDGEHTLRIVQNTVSGTAGSTTSQHSNIDYVRYSAESYIPAIDPIGGDRCQNDVTPPVTELDGQVLDGAPGLSVSLEAVDPGPEPSGVARVEYRINDGPWIEYEDVPFELTGPGVYAVDYRSIDVAGNVEATKRTTVFLGTNGNDTINGTTGDDVIVAGNGNNSIKGNGGNDVIYAGNGNDKITTGDGNDTIDAGHGNNQVNAGDGDNVVTTGNGNDKITTGDGNDTIDAGHGNNQVNAGDGSDQVVTGSGNDRVDCGPGFDTATVGGGSNINVGSRCEVFQP